MPCKHKFYDELRLDQVDYEPETLIVGTFSPEWPADNIAEWFYGRTDESLFWDILPRVYGKQSLLSKGVTEWRQFCKDQKIALTDLISEIEDADVASKKHQKMLGGFSDKAIMHNFDDFDFTNIVSLLQKHRSIKNVYLTRGITEAFWRHLWSTVMRYSNSNGLHERILLTPDESAAYQYEAYNTANPDIAMPALSDYLVMRWKEVWHH
ncbi:MAG: hypothetical protein KF744_16245 [Taibaiella sp.]|nr:hypothetical protein [Taibaiella sp.]